MKTPLIASTKARLATSAVASASILITLPAIGQITAVDDGAPGSPFTTSDEDTSFLPGPSVIANDTGSVTATSGTSISNEGVAVSIDPSGTFTYDPAENGVAQALASGESTEDQFTYSIFETPTPSVPPSLALNTVTGVNSFGWGSLPAIQPATGANVPAAIADAYTFGGRATRTSFNGVGDTADFSFEFWFKADALANAVLFETGGATIGSSILLNSDGTISHYQSVTNPESIEVRSDIGIATYVAGSWHHLVVTGDLNESGGTADRVRIYLDTTLVADNADSSTLTDWSGADSAGLGGASGGDIGGDISGTGPLQVNYSNFQGQMALMNFYQNTVLTAAQVQADYLAWTSPATDSATTTIGITGANDAPDGVNDIFLTGPRADDASFSGTRDLTANDGKYAANAADFSAPGSNLSRSGIATIETSQSPTTASPPGGGFASRGIDGNPSTFTHTETDVNVNHRWTLDFGVSTNVGSVALDNRSDCCGIRLRDITITLEDENGTELASSPELNDDNVEGFTNTGGQPGLSHDFAAANGGNPISGVYRVVVTRTPDLTDPNDSNGSVLSLGEVTVLGSTPTLRVDQELTLHHDARFSTGSGRWENQGILAGDQADWLLGSGVTLNSSVASARSQIIAAYEWDGTSNATAAFANGPLEGLAGTNIDTGSVTIELWAKLGVADLNQAVVLFETGGGAGLGIGVDNGTLQFATGNQTGLISYDLVNDPAGVMGGLAPTAEFFQISAVLDQSRDVGLLFVNGRYVGQADNATTDWSGADQAGLGRFEGTNAGGFASPAAGGAYDTFFNGSIASFSLWNAALPGGIIRQNFEAIANGTDVDGDTLTIEGVIDATGVLVPLNSPATLASGAIVTMTDATGSFTYEPNGSFESLGGGEVGMDSFTYRLSDGNGGVGAAAVSLPVTGVTAANNDTLAATELIVTNLPTNFLVANDERTAPSPGSYFSIDPANLSGSTIPNSGDGGSAFDLTVNGGGVIMPSTLRSNFGAIGAALQNGSGSFSSLDPIGAGDATFEIWFQPPPFQSGQQLLLDSGGSGNGLSIVYDADLNRIVFTVDGGNDISDIIQATASGVVPGEFNQLVAIYDRDASGTADDLTVYLNSDPTAFDASVKGSGTNAAGSANDWSGTDLSGIGAVTGTTALGETPDPFVGQIGITRIYNRKLSIAEIEANFDSVVQPITGLVGGSPLTTSLGAVVTLKADGSVDYDATSLNANIPEGNVVQDTFDYVIADGLGGTATATATIEVTGVGSFLAVDDSFTVTEDDGITTLDVRGNDLDAGAATVLFQAPESGYGSSLSTFAASAVADDPADFTDGNGYGWRLLWNPPSDWDLANTPASLLGTGGALGNEANYVPLVWTGSEWTPDGDADTTNNSPAGFAALRPGGTGHPGLGSATAGTTGNDQDRAVIAAYTASTTGYYGIANSLIESLGSTSTGLRVIVYVVDTEVINVSVSGGATSNFDGALGLVNQGETIYIALSPDGTASSDSFTWDFDLVTLPGPDAVPTVTLGAVSTNGTDILYTPSSTFQALGAGESITETINYTIDDGGTLSTASATVTIDGVNDLPVGVDDAGGFTNEAHTLTGTGLLDNDTDPDTGEALSLIVGEVQGSAGNVGNPVATALGGLVTVNADGSFTYDPRGAFDALDLGQIANDSFTYSPQDQQGANASPPASVTIEVGGLETNQQAVGLNLTQTVEYLSGSSAAGLFMPPSVSDPNGASPVTTTASPEFSSASEASFTLPAPATPANGFAVAVRFTPDAADVANGARVTLYENGGTSNGNGIYLLDGIPHFVAAMNSSGTLGPSGRSDLDWDSGKICVPLGGVTLDAAIPSEIAVVFSLDTLDFTVNGSAPITVVLTGRTGQTNWSGSNTLNFGNQDSAGNRGALSDGTAPDFGAGVYSALAGSVEYGEIWFDGRVTTTGLTPEQLTATLTVNPTEGSLTAPTGASYDGGSGTWTATGHQARINALVAATTFVPNGTSPVDVTIGIADGGEGGTTPVSGTLTFTSVTADQGTDSDGDSLSDFLERAFGTDPGVSDNSDLALDGSVNGLPIVNVDFSGGLTFEAVFTRRDDHGVPGSFNYTVEFSPDLLTWEASTETPTVVTDSTDDPDYEIVSLPYPFFVNDQKARFYRVRVESVN